MSQSFVCSTFDAKNSFNYSIHANEFKSCFTEDIYDPSKSYKNYIACIKKDTCQKQGKCEYYHVPKDNTSKNICPLFLSSNSVYGGKCGNSNEFVNKTPMEARQRNAKLIYLANKVKRGFLNDKLIKSRFSDLPYYDDINYDLCTKRCLDPVNEKLQNNHVACEKTFSISKSKNCGICKDNIVEKFGGLKNLFGILSNCDHAFCLDCITDWSMNNSDMNLQKCPECQEVISLIIPSHYWVTGKEKDKLIENYEKTLEGN